MAVMPSRVPATLKSMSPRKSSRPWMSVRIAMLPVESSLMRPIATPATDFLIGTPASSSASVLAQMEACEVEPFELMTSLTRRMQYGNSASLGNTGSSARSASAPCPTSRRPTPRMGFASPVLNGGMLYWCI